MGKFFPWFVFVFDSWYSDWMNILRSIRNISVNRICVCLFLFDKRMVEKGDWCEAFESNKGKRLSLACPGHWQWRRMGRGGRKMLKGWTAGGKFRDTKVKHCKMRQKWHNLYYLLSSEGCLKYVKMVEKKGGGNSQKGFEC